MGFVKQLITGGGHIVLYVGLIGDVPLVLWYATVMPLFLCGGGGAKLSTCVVLHVQCQYLNTHRHRHTWTSFFPTGPAFFLRLVN